MSTRDGTSGKRSLEARCGPRRGTPSPPGQGGPVVSLVLSPRPPRRPRLGTGHQEPMPTWRSQPGRRNAKGRSVEVFSKLEQRLRSEVLVREHRPGKRHTGSPRLPEGPLLLRWPSGRRASQARPYFQHTERRLSRGACWERPGSEKELTSSQISPSLPSTQAQRSRRLPWVSCSRIINVQNINVKKKQRFLSPGTSVSLLSAPPLCETLLVA